MMSELRSILTNALQWPGYEPWSTVVHIVDHSYEVRPSSLGKLAHDIAKVINELKKVQRFLAHPEIHSQGQFP